MYAALVHGSPRVVGACEKGVDNQEQYGISGFGVYKTFTGTISTFPHDLNVICTKYYSTNYKSAKFPVDY